MRRAAVLTQVDLAMKAGVSEATVVSAEKGEPIRISTVRKLAVALGASPQELLAPNEGEKEE